MNSRIFIFLCTFFFLYSCTTNQPKNTNDEKDTKDTLAADRTKIKPEPVETGYLIKSNSFQEIVIGSEIAKATNLKKGVLETGEADFEVLYIMSTSGEELGYVFPDPENESLVGQIYVSSPLAKTEKGVHIGMEYGELEKLISDFKVHGSEIESRTYVDGTVFSYRLDAANSTYEVDPKTLSKEAKVIEILVGGK